MAFESQIPEVLKAHILPLRWDVRRVWALEAPVVEVPRQDFDYLLELPIWSSRKGAGMLFDVVPMAVIRDPSVCPYQARRIEDADTRWPLDFLLYQGRPWILDGVHRLARHRMEGAEVIRVRFHPQDVARHIEPII